LERDIAVIGGHKIIPEKDFHFSPVYASALPSPARPRQKVLTVSSRPDFFRKKPFGENVEGLSHFADGSCSFKIVFK
jgi:hypothetical protein